MNEACARRSLEEVARRSVVCGFDGWWEFFSRTITSALVEARSKCLSEEGKAS